MKIATLAVTAVLIGGCTSIAGHSRSGSYMPGVDQENRTNPYLLNCPDRAMPVCDVDGGRTRKVYSNCRCVGF